MTHKPQVRAGISKLTLEFPTGLHRRFLAYCNETDKSMAKVVRRLVEQEVSQWETRNVKAIGRP